MRAHFHKYHGAGNDFILIDNRDHTFLPNRDEIRSMCRRRFGIGADGLMLLETSGDYDFSMRYYNSDGRESTMCGNGGRCMVSFARSLGLTGQETIFVATDGPHQARILDNGLISLKMKDVTGIRKYQEDDLIDTGSPHYVKHVEDPDKVDVLREGQSIRHDPSISESGVNVNFIHPEDNRHIRIRTFERGVEDETLACGTGSVAAAISTWLRHPADKFSYTIHAPGGNLQIEAEPHGKKSFRNIWLTGPAEFVYEGWI